MKCFLIDEIAVKDGFPRTVGAEESRDLPPEDPERDAAERFAMGEAPGQVLDMWHMKGQRTGPLGFVDDQYTDDTRYDPKTAPNAGRKGDPGPQGGEYTNIALVNGKPQFMNRDAKPANAGGTYYIKKGETVPFDDSKFKPGDEVASIIINPLDGTDRGDVRVANSYANGMHTSVVSRKLVTGSKFDVQFDIR